MDHKNSQSASYAAAGVDITAGYKAVELMKKHVARTRNEGCLDDVGGFGGCHDLVVGGVRLSVGDVVPHRSGEQPGILQYHAKAFAQGAAVKVLYVVAIQRNGAGVDIVKAHEKFYDGGFACTRRSNDGSRLSCADTGTEIVDDDFIIRVTEFYVVEFHIPAEF